MHLGTALGLSQNAAWDFELQPELGLSQGLSPFLLEAQDENSKGIIIFDYSFSVYNEHVGIPIAAREGWGSLPVDG